MIQELQKIEQAINSGRKILKLTELIYKSVEAAKAHGELDEALEAVSRLKDKVPTDGEIEVLANERIGQYVASEDPPIGVAISPNRYADQRGCSEVHPLPVEQPKDEHRITLCGSTKFKREFTLLNEILTLDGHVVYSVCMFGHAEGRIYAPEQKQMLDDVHKRKIDNSDAILVIDVGGYIGESTRSEIAHAERTGKHIEYLSKRPDLQKRIEGRQPKDEPLSEKQVEDLIRQVSDAIDQMRGCGCGVSGPCGDCCRADEKADKSLAEIRSRLLNLSTTR